MVLTIEELTNRVVFLESQILLLLSSCNSSCKIKKHSSAFNIFAKYFTPHVRSVLFNNNFILTKDLHFKPTHQQIITEISAMWNDLTLEEKSHWKL